MTEVSPRRDQDFDAQSEADRYFSFAPGRFGPIPDEHRPPELSAADAYPTVEWLEEGEVDPDRIQTHMPERSDDGRD